MKELLVDIETTGLAANDQVTICGLLETPTEAFNIHYLIPEQLQDNTDENELTVELLEHIKTTTPEEITETYQFKLRGWESEQELLENAYNDVYADTENIRIVGYNSDSYDLPTLRTRSMINGVDWGFSGCTSRDIYTLFQYKFNTTSLTVDGLKKAQKKKFGEEIDAPVDSDMYSAELTDAIEEYGYTPEQLDEFVTNEGLNRPTKETNSLDHVHELLGGEITQYDPFKDSEEAVEAFSNGNIGPVLVHNIIDLLATNELNNVINGYVSERDINDRQL